MPEQTFPQARLIHRLNRTVLPVTQAGIGVWARQRPAIGATAAESQAAHWPTPRQKCVLSFKTHSSSSGSRFARSHLPNIFHAKARPYSTKGHACPFGLVTRFQRCGENGRSGRIRTRGPRFWRPMLYQLSYTPVGGGACSAKQNAWQGTLHQSARHLEKTAHFSPPPLLLVWAGARACFLDHPPRSAAESLSQRHFPYGRFPR